MTQIIKINEVYPNPELGNEWIEFFIEEELIEELSLNNYTIFDSYHQIYKFTTEKFDGQLLVVEVSGLNNDQDSVILKDASGNVLDSFSYTSSQKGLSWSRETQTNNFLLSEASPGQINPTPTPTATTTPTPSSSATISPTSSPTVTPTSASANQTTHASPNNSDQSKQVAFDIAKTYSYDLSKVKLITEEKVTTDRITRLVILGKNQGQTEIINAIIGSAVIILSSLYLLYVKRKSKQN